MKIAILTTDNREQHQQYQLDTPYFGTAPEALLQGFAALEEVEVHVISCSKRLMKSPEKLASNIWFHSLYVPHLGWGRTFFQGCIRAVRKKLQNLNPDIVHGQGTERDCALTAAFSGFPNLLTIHGNMRRVAQIQHARLFSYYWIMAKLESFSIARVGGVVCITRYTQKAVEKLAKKTWIIPNAVDQTFFDLKRQPNKKKTILCVGGVYLVKNQNAFIQALDPIAKHCSFEVIFLGRATREEEYGAEFFNLLVDRPWCRYEGFADREQLKNYLKSATLLALPSLEDNCPMVVLEAMAVGVPVVASRIGGLPDLIEDNITGIFCDPTNPESIGQAIKSLLIDEKLAENIANEAKKRSIKRFHPKLIAEQHLLTYKSFLNERT